MGYARVTDFVTSLLPIFHDVFCTLRMKSLTNPSLEA